MAFSFIDEDELVERFEGAKKYMLPLFESFDEFERIARNKPHPGIDKSLPKVTDGTLAAIIQEAPKRIIQQIPTGSMVANDRWLEIVGDYLLDHEILPNSNTVASLIQKCWALTSKALTYGAQPAFVQFINRGDYFGTDFTLPYIRDVLLEPGKLSDRDSNVIFLRAWYQPNQIDAIIKKEDMLVKNSKDRKDAEVYESGWDTAELEKCKDQVKQKDVQSQTPNEKVKYNSKGFIEIVHVFQRGIGAQFYSFSPATKAVVRRRVNKDPRGQIPIHYMYANVDLSNPLGRGAVEISGGMQNLLDSEVQSYQYMRALLINPPLIVRGNVSASTLKYAPGATWKLSSNPTDNVEPAKLETASLQQFPQNYALIKSQIMQLNSADDNAVSADAGNTNSKTQAGVKSQQNKLGIADNYIRRQFESVFEEIINTEINLYFAERSGTQELTVDVETADKLKQIEDQPGQYISPDNVIRIDYDSETPKLDFKVNPTSSTEVDNQEQIADLQMLIHDTSTNPYIPYLLQAEGKELHMGEVYEQLFTRYGLKDMDKIITEIEKDPQTGQPKPPSVMTPFFDKPKLTINYKDLSPKAQVQALANGGVNLQEQDILEPNIEQMAGGGTKQNPVAPATIDPQTGEIIVPQEPAVPSASGTAEMIKAGVANSVQPAPHPQDLANHPLVKIMEVLQIKFTDLPEDSKHELLSQLGIASTMQTPVAQNTAIAASNAAVKVAELHHKVNVQAQSHNLAASDAAVKVAQLTHQENVANTQADQANKTHDLAKQQSQQSAQQANQSHQLAVKVANKPAPKPTAGVK